MARHTQYWTQFWNDVHADSNVSHILIKGGNKTDKNWFNVGFATAKMDDHIVLGRNTKNNCISAQLYFFEPSDEFIRQFEMKSDVCSSLFADKLEIPRHARGKNGQTGKAVTITVARQMTDIENSDHWSDHIMWMKENALNLIHFYNYVVFNKELPSMQTPQAFSEDNSFFPETVETPTDCFEGAVSKITVNRYERNPEARKKCIELYGGAFCLICGFDFERVYGELGRDYIHVHHIVPISEIGQEYKIDYKKDLIPVCPNCHAMLHRKINGRTLSPQELRKLISDNAKK